MRMRSSKKLTLAATSNRNAGFTLLEVLISLVIFTVGLLGILRFTGNVMGDISDNELRASAMTAVSQRFTQVRQDSINRALPATAAASTRALVTNLTDMATAPGVPVSNGRNSYTILVKSATASDGTNVINAANGTPLPAPISVGAQITYTGKNGVQTFVAPFVFN